MGDRTNLVVATQEGFPNVYLYTHWGREYLPHDVQSVLNRRARWDDAQDLTRMLIIVFFG